MRYDLDKARAEIADYQRRFEAAFEVTYGEPYRQSVERLATCLQHPERYAEARRQLATRYENVKKKLTM